MLSPIKTVLIISSTIAPMDTNMVYKLPKDYSYEARVSLEKQDKHFLSDEIYKQIYKENNPENHNPP